MAPKDYCLEHTKPIFNETEILVLHNLYVKHTFIDLFKILKGHSPVSVFNLFIPSPRNTNFLLHLPRIKLDNSKYNFVFSATVLWNSLLGKVLDPSEPTNSGLVIQGSSRNSDLTASIPFIKIKLQNFLLKQQNIGNSKDWIPSNFFFD